MRRSFRLLPALLSPLVLVSCGTAAGTPEGVGGGGTLTISQRGEAGAVRMLLEDEVRVRRDTLRGEAERLWEAARRAYRSLGLEVRVRDPETRVLGSGVLRLNRRLGETRLSRYLDCGRNIAGPRADRARVTLEVVTQILPLDGEPGSRVVSGLTAVAEPRGVSGNETRCTSTGRLERAIVAALALEAGVEWEDGRGGRSRPLPRDSR